MSDSVDCFLHYEISKFYFREARLFSAGDYRGWLETMVDPEIHYWLPIFEERYRADRKPEPEFLPAIYDDNYDELDMRIRQLETHLARRTDPASRIRHMITNIEAFHADVTEEFDVLSNFLVCRNRREHEQIILVGGREDRLRKHGDSFRLVKRKIVIPQRVILDSDLYYMM